MSSSKTLGIKIAMEAIWWLITFVVIWIVTAPMWAAYIKNDYIYDSILNIIIFITFTRYLFLLKYTWLAHVQAAKFIIIFSCLLLVFYLIQQFFAYQDFVDKEGTALFMSYFRPDIQPTEWYRVMNYTTKEISFFGVGAIIATIVLPFRLLVSFWRVYNDTGTV